MASLAAQQTLIVVTGLSGSGKSVALNTLEDLGYYCVDNLPLALVHTFLDHGLTQRGGTFERLALGLDARSGLQDAATLAHTLSTLRLRLADTRVFFLHADDATLIRRYSESRRRHPLAANGIGLADAIRRENELIQPLARSADTLLDTSALSVHQLRREICNQLGAGDQPLALLIESFAFKSGVPQDVDFAFDVRCLPNPHWEPALRPLSGREAPVQEFLAAHEEVQSMVTDICAWLERWIPAFEREHRNYLTVGIGCTGGKHRSVYVAERVARYFEATREHVLSYHRELL